MERNRDLRRASISSINGLPRRRQRITTLKDSTDQDMQETVRLEVREQLHKKDREREFPKRRRVDRFALQQRSDGVEIYRENECTDSSGEEYYEEEEERQIRQHNRTNQVLTSYSQSINRRGLRTLRSSPVLRAAADEMFGVPIPRRARSVSAKRLHELCNSGSGGFGEDLSHRGFSPSPATVSLIDSGSASPSSSGASLKKKTKSVDWKTPVFSGASNPNPSAIQDDIEIEVAEALFDLMKQSQSSRVHRDCINTGNDELQTLKADGGKDENNAFSVQNEPSIKVNAETILGDAVNELKREGIIEREKLPDDPAQDLVNGDGFVNKIKVGSPKESESPSCVTKANACDIQDPTVTKAHNEAIIAAAKKEAKLDIGLMALPPVPQSPERDALVNMETDPEVVLKKSETISKDGPLAVEIGVINSFQLHMEKHRNEDTSAVGNSNAHQQQGLKEQNNPSPTALLPPLPVGMSSWPGVLTHPGCIPPMQTVLPMSGRVKSSMIMQTPQFKFSKPRRRRCTTHHFLAHNIHSHHELIKKSLSSVSTGPVPLHGTNSSNLKYMLPPNQNFIPGNPLVGDFQGGPNQNFIPGNPLVGDFQGGPNAASTSVESVKDRNCDAVMASNASDKSLLQQASHPASASNFLRGPAFMFPFGHHQTTNSSCGSAQSGRLSGNLPLPSASSTVSMNYPFFSSNEAYMAMLQNNGCPFPISTNISMPSFKGGSPSMPQYNPSLYSSPVYNISQTQQQQQQLTIPQTTNSSSYKQLQCQKQTGDNKFPSNPQSVANSLVSQSSNSQPINFSMIIPPGNKNMDPSQQGSKGGRMDLVPQAFALSFGANAPPLSMAQNSPMFHIVPDMSWNGNQMKIFHQASEGKSLTSGAHLSKSDYKDMGPPPKLDGLARSIHPSSLIGNQNHQQLIQVQNSQMHQLQLSGPTGQVKPSTSNGSFLTSMFPSNNHPASVLNDNSSIPQLKKSGQGQSHITLGNNSTSAPSFSRSMGISLKSGSTVGTVASTISAQEMEASPAQKSTSPACRRIVPSILSTYPSQLPELKY